MIFIQGQDYKTHQQQRAIAGKQFKNELAKLKQLVEVDLLALVRKLEGAKVA